MKYEIIPTPQFEKDISFYKRKKKYHRIDDDVDEIITELEKGNLIGDEIEDLHLPNEKVVTK